MIPISNTVNPFPQPVTLVATALPETNAVRAPVYTVPPSFSSPQVNNNARGNGGAYVPIDNPPVAVAETPVRNISGSFREPLSASGGVQAPFLAQLISQYSPTTLQGVLGGVLSEYEKMVFNSYVKYGNSYAALVQTQHHAQPSDAFARVLQQETPEPAPQPAAPVKAEAAPIPQPSPPIEQVAAASLPAAAAAPLPQKERTEIKAPAQNPLPTVKAAAPKAAPAAGAIAYLLTAARSETSAPASVTA